MPNKSLPENFASLYKELVSNEPHLAMHVWLSENSDYCDQIDRCKNCYLCFNNLFSEDCMYCYDSRWNKDCTDLSYSNKCELCYEAIDCEKCYNCDHCQDVKDSTDCEYSYDLKSCSNCFGCTGLRHKQFHIFNEKVTKENYKKTVDNLKKDPAKVEKKLEELKLKTPRIALYLSKSEGSFGNYVLNCKNSYYVHKVHNLEDCMYMYDCQEDKDCMDCCAFNKSELSYGCIENTTLYNCNFMYWCATCNDCEFMMYCFDCKDCFGCFNLKNRKYCILNKQYEKDEYFELVAKIKENLKAENRYSNLLYDVIC